LLNKLSPKKEVKPIKVLCVWALVLAAAIFKYVVGKEPEDRTLKFFNLSHCPC